MSDLIEWFKKLFRVKPTWDDDGLAWKFLKDRGWTEEKFVLRHPYILAEFIEDDEWEAACFLINEYDWAYDAEPRSKEGT